MLANRLVVRENFAMTEFSPFSEEQSPNPSDGEYENVLSASTWNDFCAAIEEVEAGLRIYDSSEVPDDYIQDRVMELENMLGEEYFRQPAKVLGLGHQLMGHNTLSAVETILDSSDVTYIGVDLHYTEDQWRVYLEFYVSEHTDKVPHGYYCVLPDKRHLVEFKIKQSDIDEVEDEPEILDVVHEVVRAVCASTQAEDFQALPLTEKRTAIDHLIEAANSDIPKELWSNNLPIDCLRYYTAYDDMQGIDLRDSLTDFTTVEAQERKAIVGRFDGFVYPELSGPLDEPVRLDLNDGMPCMKFRNEQEERTYYVIPQEIIDVT